MPVNRLNFLDTTGKQGPLSTCRGLCFRRETPNLILYSFALYIHLKVNETRSNLGSLCAASLESRARGRRDAEASQALGQAVGPPAGKRERSVAAEILLGRRHQPLLSVSATVSLSPVLRVAAPLPPEARTLLAAQMVQRRCSLSRA